jgi:hypothetical protein
MMGMTMRIGLLGALQIRDREGRQVPVGGRRARMLFASLARDGALAPAAGDPAKAAALTRSPPTSAAGRSAARYSR